MVSSRKSSPSLPPSPSANFVVLALSAESHHVTLEGLGSSLRVLDPVLRAGANLLPYCPKVVILTSQHSPVCRLHPCLLLLCWYLQGNLQRIACVLPLRRFLSKMPLWYVFEPLGRIDLYFFYFSHTIHKIGSFKCQNGSPFPDGGSDSTTPPLLLQRVLELEIQLEVI